MTATPPAQAFETQFATTIADFNDRRERRIGVGWYGRLELDDDRALVVRISDVSASGVCLQCSEPLTPGQRVTLLTKVPGAGDPRARPLWSLTASVIHHSLHGDGHRAGLKFAGASAAQLAFVRAWLDTVP